MIITTTHNKELYFSTVCFRFQIEPDINRSIGNVRFQHSNPSALRSDVLSHCAHFPAVQVEKVLQGAP